MTSQISIQGGGATFCRAEDDEVWISFLGGPSCKEKKETNNAKKTKKNKKDTKNQIGRPVKYSSTCRRPASPMRRRSSTSLMSAVTLAAMLSVSPGSTK